MFSYVIGIYFLFKVEGLQNQINSVTSELASQRAEVAKLNDLRNRVDGLLENIFNDEYGSELEARLELESEHLLQVKQHISVAHYKWHNSKNLIHHACLQLAFAKRRWEQIKDVAPNHIQVWIDRVALRTRAQKLVILIPFSSFLFHFISF